MNIDIFNSNLLQFLQASITPFHAVHEMVKLLDKAGFTQLAEHEPFPLEVCGKFYLVRDDASIAAFTTGERQTSGLLNGVRILGAHTDSPSLQIKPQPDLLEDEIHRLGVEVYGSPLLTTWFDRELSFAGRIFYQTEGGGFQKAVVDAGRPLLVIPSLAIHLDRLANKEKSVNPQKELSPLFALCNEGAQNFKELLAEFMPEKEICDSSAQILDYELFLYDPNPAAFCGLNNEFLVGSRLDNLLSCFAAVTALTESTPQQASLMICSNHEEIGSVSANGAGSTFLHSIVERLLPDADERYAALAASFCLSIDNAHATHPNFPEKHDAAHHVHLNRGPVIKRNAAQRYATNAYTGGLFRYIAEKEQVPVQEFVMKNDMPCGSTIGPLTAAKLGIPVADIGIPTFGMHSIRETAGNRDTWLMFRALLSFLNCKQLPAR